MSGIRQLSQLLPAGFNANLDINKVSLQGQWDRHDRDSRKMKPDQYQLGQSHKHVLSYSDAVSHNLGPTERPSGGML